MPGLEAALPSIETGPNSEGKQSTWLQLNEAFQLHYTQVQHVATHSTLDLPTHAGFLSQTLVMSFIDEIIHS